MPGLKDSQELKNLRENLVARNLYTPNDPYTIDNPLLIKAINGISAVFNPTKSFDLKNTVIGRMIGPNTPIAQIGIEQLGKQFAQRVTQNALTAGLPSINFNNLFDGNPNTKLFTKRVDYRITRDEDNTTVENIVERIAGNQRLTSPLSPTRTNEEFRLMRNELVRNTGKGALNFLYDSLNRNLYKPSDSAFISTTNSEGKSIIAAGREWYERVLFPTDDPENFPNGFEASMTVVDEFQIPDLKSIEGQNNLEYGSANHRNRLGKTTNYVGNTAQNLPNQPKDKDFEFVDNSYGFGVDNVNGQVVWGRDGANTMASKFGIRTGMLAYTRALMQARGGNSSIDQTKKKWYDKDGNPMYNGSPLTRDNDGNVRTERQQNILDPYNNYQKAIRFNGNNIYDGPKESVVNRYVIPKMHPIFDKEKNVIDNKNMMFSIENLAFRLNSKGYLGDAFGTKVPLSEVGENMGRVMWFPPYGIQLSESAIAKHETTTFIGRGEPIYTYSSSERIARLGFKLIIDYPPQIRGRSHNEISKFFAFGGRLSASDLKNIDVEAKKVENSRLEAQLQTITPNKIQQTPVIKSGTYVTYYFPNDVDLVDPSGSYENGIEDGSEPNDDGLNVGFDSSVDDFVQSVINPNTGELDLVTLNFVGSASKLYVDKRKQYEYNMDLSRRRVEALYDYIQSKFQAAHGKTMEEAGVKIVKVASGSTNGSDRGAQAEFAYASDVKPERNAKVVLTRNGAVRYKEVELTEQQKNDRNKIIEQIDANKRLIAEAENFQNNDGLFVLKSVNDKEYTGFEAAEKRTLSPVFHSQTPEDFHRRLTFLQQCTRQGNATVLESTENQGIPAASNSVFGRPPVCVLRIGDFFHTKVIIDSIDFDYTDAPWDMNPEGMGMQFMIADINITMRVIGGQSLKSAIDVLQNAESFNYYANSTYYPVGVYKTARIAESAQIEANNRSKITTSSVGGESNADTQAVKP